MSSGLGYGICDNGCADDYGTQSIIGSGITCVFHGVMRVFYPNTAHLAVSSGDVCCKNFPTDSRISLTMGGASWTAMGVNTICVSLNGIAYYASVGNINDWQNMSFDAIYGLYNFCGGVTIVPDVFRLYGTLTQGYIQKF